MKKNEIKNKVRQQDAQVLAQGYSPAIRAMEITAIVAFISLELALVYRLWHSAYAGTWLLVSESGLDAGFYGSRLGPRPDGHTYTFAPPLEDEGDGVGATTATSSLPWTLPWRFVVVAPDAGSMATADLVTHRAEPSGLDEPVATAPREGGCDALHSAAPDATPA